MRVEGQVLSMCSLSAVALLSNSERSKCSDNCKLFIKNNIFSRYTRLIFITQNAQNTQNRMMQVASDHL